MTYSEFIQNIQADCKAAFPTGTSIGLRKITKNNGMELDALTILEPGQNITPTIYLNHYYEVYLIGYDYPSVVAQIYEDYQKNKLDIPFEPHSFSEFEKVKSHIAFKLIHTEKNSRLLGQVPSIGYMDLSIVFYLMFPAPQNRTASVLIYNHHLDLWETTKEILLELATENTPQLLPAEIKKMSDIISELKETAGICMENCMEPNPMYILSNTNHLQGACCMLYPDALKNFAGALACDLYILPSSIHEVILIPAYEEKNISLLNEMVREVNATQIADDEILSDHVYYFSRKSNAISM